MRLEFADSAAGTAVRCPKCKAKLIVPGTSALDADEPRRETVGPTTKRCPYCKERILRDAVKCRYCGEMLDDCTGNNRGKTGSVLLQVVGSLLFLGGLLSAISYFNMDTTVRVPANGLFGDAGENRRVHNVGLMDERRNGLIVSLAVAGGGFALAYIGQRK
jgi:DNA-directed RNA polymerase subunit RPC12/RpoP